MSKTIEIGTGRVSWFGGANDKGVKPDEGLALAGLPWGAIDPYGVAVFEARQPMGTVGEARRLNPLACYIACRWDYEETPKSVLRRSVARVYHGAVVVECKPVDWGPSIRTGRIADISPGAMRRLGCQTDDIVTVELILPAEIEPHVGPKIGGR